METKEFVIRPEKIRKRLVERIFNEEKLSETQKNILVTLIYSDPFILAYIEKIIPVEDLSITLIFSNNGKKRGVTIEYDEVLDLYNVYFDAGETIREVAGEELYPLIRRKIFLAES
ncbi:MAG: hypothetical protein JHC26_07875 [Thermofilum sp.]|jgi:hypothetical protein|uniref:hypothetical protein n=1 Tax=Thermofilum sp. TaxID=1961369 RepID=UPI00258D887C|nr:hypothetical protein [Thermofilum sp.]MCI4408995.1 hypothetical protein [Thermofilum sp.]